MMQIICSATSEKSNFPWEWIIPIITGIVGFYLKDCFNDKKNAKKERKKFNTIKEQFPVFIEFLFNYYSDRNNSPSCVICSNNNNLSFDDGLEIQYGLMVKPSNITTWLENLEFAKRCDNFKRSRAISGSHIAIISSNYYYTLTEDFIRLVKKYGKKKNN